MRVQDRGRPAGGTFRPVDEARDVTVGGCDPDELGPHFCRVERREQLGDVSVMGMR